MFCIAGQEGDLWHLWQTRAETELAVTSPAPRQKIAAFAVARQDHGVVEPARRFHVTGGKMLQYFTEGRWLHVRNRNPAVFIADEMLDNSGNARALAVPVAVASINRKAVAKQQLWRCDRATHWWPSCPNSPLPHVITYLPQVLHILYLPAQRRRGGGGSCFPSSLMATL